MPMTVEELFERGGHHTVESLIERGEATFTDALEALQRRFGSDLTGSDSAVAQLYQQVIDAINAAGGLQSIEGANPLTYGRNPSLPDQYQYIVVGSLPNPLNPDEQITVPWTINSPVPLSFLDVLDRANEELNQGYDRDQKYMSAQYADLHRRDIAWQRIVKEQYGNEAPVDVTVIGAYRRG